MKDVQSNVETPQLYIIARSSSSLTSQLTFHEECVKDLMTINSTVDGFHDGIRFFMGDAPHRAVENGYQQNGNYPCACGVYVDTDKPIDMLGSFRCDLV